MPELDLRALERKARETRDYLDVQRYCEALERLGPTYIQTLLGKGSDYWQNLIYRHVLKNLGRSKVDLDLTLRHTWEFCGGRDVNYGAARVQLVAEANEDPKTGKSDFGLHPFIGKDARPLTFKETVEAMLEQSDQWRMRFFDNTPTEATLWLRELSTCTGIVWEAGGDRFKIVALHPQLLAMTPESYQPDWLEADFANTPGSPIRADRSYGSGGYTLNEALHHPGWLAALEGDRNLLARLVAEIFSRREERRAMPFFSCDQDMPDHLVPLTIGSRACRRGSFRHTIFPRLA